MKRINHRTGKYFKRGDFDPSIDMYFYKYELSKLDEDGYFRLHWLHKKSIERAVQKINDARKDSVKNKKEGKLIGKKKINPSTGNYFVYGDAISDNRIFVSYDFRFVDKDGFFICSTTSVDGMHRKRIINRLNTLKNSARKRKIIFDLDADYLIDIYPKDNKCPVLGIDLVWGGIEKSGKGGPAMNSPSIDKMVPDLGYVKGNVSWMSMRANYIKQDATPEELIKVANWINTAVFENQDKLTIKNKSIQDLNFHYKKYQDEIELIDREYLSKFNPKNKIYEPQIRLRPCPFEGDLKKAKVILLLANPGFTPSGKNKSSEKDHDRNGFDDWGLWGLSECTNESMHKWWRDRLKSFINNEGSEEEWRKLSLKIASIQAVPWASENFHEMNGLPSKKLIADTVKAISKGKIFVIMRQRTYWEDVLKGQDCKIIYTKSSISSYLTNGNLDSADFKKLKSLLA